MKICCEEIDVQDDDIYIYKGASKQHRQKINAHETQVNPLLYESEERILMFAKSKNEVTVEKCQQLNQKYKDLQFHPCSESIGKYEGRKINWARLSQIINTFAPSQYKTTDILSLKKGDKYFLASLTALSQLPTVIDEIFDEQLKLNSVGAYKLNISLKGKPQQIIIDDYLPVFADNLHRSAFTHIDPSYVWVVLLEKTFAKIQGKYQKINYGYPHEVLTTFSMSPCLYKFIPTDFRHQQQENVWSVLQQCQKLNFPAVVGSRKRFTCKAIIPHQSYCFKACKISNKYKVEEKIISLWNVPGAQQFQQKGITYEQNEDVINLKIVEFMRNFEIIDIAHVRPHYSSHFYEFKLKASTPILYAFTTVQKTSIYLTLQRQLGTKGRLRLILVNCSNEANYEYISGKKQQIFDDVTVHVQKLNAGSYIVLCQSETNSTALLRVYSQKATPLINFTDNKDNILERVLKKMAKNSHSQQTYLSKEKKDWYLSKVLFQQLGLAFFAIFLDQKSPLKFQLNISKKQLSLEGMSLVNKNVKDGYAVIIEKGQSDILIFEFNGKNKDSYSFPPTCMNIKVTI